MKFPVATLVGVIPFGIAVAAPVNGGALAHEQHEQKVTVTNLLHDPLGVSEGLEVVSYVVAAPGGAPAVTKHRHYGDEFIYVLDGAVTVMVEGAAPVTVRKGEMFHVPYNVVHSAKNPSATEPDRVLVLHVKETGKPVKVSVKSK